MFQYISINYRHNNSIAQLQHQKKVTSKSLGISGDRGTSFYSMKSQRISEQNTARIELWHITSMIAAGGDYLYHLILINFTSTGESEATIDKYLLIKSVEVFVLAIKHKQEFFINRVTE